MHALMAAPATFFIKMEDPHYRDFMESADVARHLESPLEAEDAR